MRDHLLDLIQHTVDLGFIDTVKITGNDKETTITGVAEDKSVVLDGKFSGPIADFIGTFGMPNLSKLKIILNLEEYSENAKLSMTKRSNGDLDGIEFENAAGDFKNTYRFMVANVINAKLQAMTFKEPSWDVEFEPTNSGIQRLKWQAQANAEETYFTVKTENGDLKMFFGDPNTHAGNFVFHPGVNGTVKRAWSWPKAQVISILNSVGDKVMKISDGGAAMITVDSGLATYRYILPAQTK
jgi:hypothetical protein